MLHLSVRSVSGLDRFRFAAKLHLSVRPVNVGFIQILFCSKYGHVVCPHTSLCTAAKEVDDVLVTSDELHHLHLLHQIRHLAIGGVL